MQYIISIVDEKGRKTKMSVAAEIYHSAKLDGEYDDDLRIVLTVPSHVFDYLESDRKEQDRLEKREEYHQQFRFGKDGILTNEVVETDAAMPSAEAQSMQFAILAKAYTILESCTETQRRRFFQYFLVGQSMIDIAKKEKCSRKVVWKSIQAVVQKLKDELQDDYHPDIFY